MTRFEERFEERLRSFARTGVQSVDSAAVARTVAIGPPKSAATRPARLRPLDAIHRTRRQAVSRATFAAAAIVAVIALGAAFAIGRPSPTPSSNPSPSLPGVVAPSSTPSGLSPEPTPSAVTNPAGVWITTGSMITPRSGHDAVRLLDGRVLVVGGANGEEDATSAELYDPLTGTWSATGNMLKPHGDLPATLLGDGKVLVGDVDDPDADDQVNGAEVYDPASGTWTTTGKMVHGGGATATLLLDGRVLVRGDSGSELYDPDSGTWAATRSRPEQRHSHAAILLPDGRVLVAGGHVTGDDPTDSAELYDPDTGAWTAAANMHDERDLIEAFLLPDGRVLVVGGSWLGRSDPEPVELYDPISDSWARTGDVSRPRNPVNLSTLLPDGRVLVRSGGDSTFADLYDPSTGIWTTTAAMLRPHGTPAILLLDGTVLVAGGRDCLDGMCVATGSAELYVPAGVSPPPLPAFPSPPPTVFPSPTPIPTPYPPEAGPVPTNARPWQVRVVNKSAKPATLFVAEEDERGTMARLAGNATPHVVPPGTTVWVTFLLPAKGVDGWSIWVNPGPDLGGLVGWTDVPLAGYIYIGPEGQLGWVSP